MTDDYSRVRCAHGYVFLQDSCPGCDSEGETPHEAEPVQVKPGWAMRVMTRCRRCGEIPSHRIHQTGGA